MTTQTKTFAPATALASATAVPASEARASAAAAGSAFAAASGSAPAAFGTPGSQASHSAHVAPDSGSAARPVVPGSERCAFLRALGAIRDGAVSLVATTALVLGAAWLLRRA